MYRYTTRDVQCYLWLEEKMHCKMLVQQVWHFMCRILQVHWRRMLYLRLPIDSVRHYRRYANINISSKPHFPIYGQNPRTYTQKYVSEKTRITPYFTQSGIFHWLSQTITHHWARIIYIILKNNNCKEVCVAILLGNFFISWWFLTKKLQLVRTCPFSFLSVAQNMFIFEP